MSRLFRRADQSAGARPAAPPALRRPAYIAVAGTIVAATLAILWAFGRPPVCACSSFLIWNADATGPENSQHLLDWYSGLHAIFGMMCFGVMWLTSRHWPLGWLFVVAIAASSAWEIAENTPVMIHLFGQSAAGANYRGDSLINSLTDMIFMLGGFWAAMRLPAIVTMGLAVAIEAVVAFNIHDSLLIGLYQLAAQVARSGPS